MPHFLVRFGERAKLVKYREEEMENDGVTLYSLVCSAVTNLIKSDELLVSLSSQSFFLKYYHKVLSCFVEFDNTTELADIDMSFSLEFVLQKDVDMTISSTDGSVDNTRLSNVAPRNTTTSTEGAKSYLNMIGVDFSHTATPASIASANSTSSNSSKTTTVHASANSKRKVAPEPGMENQQPTQISRSRKRNKPADDDAVVIGSYEEQVILKRKRNEEFLKEHNLITVPDPKVPKVKKRKTPANKKTTTGEIRVMPSRRAKERQIKLLDLEAEDAEEVDQPTDPALAEESPTSGDTSPNLLISGTPASQQPVQRKAVLRWSYKEPSVKEKKLTRFMPLTPLPASLENELLGGKLNIRNVNSYLIAHTNKLIGRDPCRGEYGILAEQFTSLLTTLGAENASSFTSRIRLSVSSAVRAKKAYATSIKAKRAAQKQARLMRANVQLATNGVPDNSIELEPEPDAKLRRPVVNKEAVKKAIRSSVVRLEYFQVNTVKQIMTTYPYLHHCDLMIYEYSTRVPMPLEEIQVNFDKALVPLASILDKEDTNSDLQKVEVYQDLDNFFVDESKSETTTPLLQLWDTSIKAVSSLDNLPKGQAPAIVILKTIDKLQSVSLTFDGEKLLTLANPTAFECIALLMAPYYVFNCEFPSAYRDCLFVIEAILHGTVNLALQSCNDKCRRRLGLLQKLSTAMTVG